MLGQRRPSNETVQRSRRTRWLHAVAFVAVWASIGSALGAGANSVNGLSFGFADQKGLESDARKSAVADAKSRAQDIADALGVKLGDPLQVTEGGISGQPPPVFPMAADGRGSAAAPPISPGELTVSDSVYIVFSISK